MKPKFADDQERKKIYEALKADIEGGMSVGEATKARKVTANTWYDFRKRFEPKIKIHTVEEKRTYNKKTSSSKCIVIVANASELRNILGQI